MRTSTSLFALLYTCYLLRIQGHILQGRDNQKRKSAKAQKRKSEKAQKGKSAGLHVVLGTGKNGGKWRGKKGGWRMGKRIPGKEG
jgi:hypothetical protein